MIQLNLQIGPEEKKLKELFEAGTPITKLLEIYAPLNRPTITLILKVQGCVIKRGRPLGSIGPRKLSNADIQWVLREDKKGELSLSEMGRRFGVTREWIRQICQMHFHPPRRPRMNKTRDQLAIKEQVREDKIMLHAFVHALWMDHLPCAFIAEVIEAPLYQHYPYPAAMAGTTYVSHLRKRYGRKLFPGRKGGDWHVRKRISETRLRNNARNKDTSDSSFWIRELRGNTASAAS